MPGRAYHAHVATDFPQEPPADPPEPSGLVLTPFRGVRYAPEKVSDLAAVTAPPYDLIDGDAAQRLREMHRRNVVRLIRPDGAYDDRYGSARDTLRRWLSEGVLTTDAQPALYVYEQRSRAGTQRGLLGGVRLTRPENGIVLPHEDTTPGPIADRLRLLRATEANLEPVFLLYEGGGTASRLVDEVAERLRPACVAATEDEVTYRLWAVTEPAEHARVAEDLRSRTALIADGHHRYATYLRFQEERRAEGYGSGAWDFGLAFLVDASTHPPRLGAVHRVVPGLRPREALRWAERGLRAAWHGRDAAAAREVLAEAARQGPAFLLGGDGTYHLLTDPDPVLTERALPADHSPRWYLLSTAVLHHLLMPVLWGVQDDDRSAFIVHNDADAACRLAERSDGTAVLLPRLEASDVFAVAREGERVPRKSTSFGPKPRTGLVLRVLGD